MFKYTVCSSQKCFKSKISNFFESVKIDSN